MVPVHGRNRSSLLKFTFSWTSKCPAFRGLGQSRSHTSSKTACRRQFSISPFVCRIEAWHSRSLDRLSKPDEQACSRAKTWRKPSTRRVMRSAACHRLQQRAAYCPEDKARSPIISPKAPRTCSRLTERLLFRVFGNYVDAITLLA